MSVGMSQRCHLRTFCCTPAYAAVLELPNYASGIDDQIRRLVTEKAIEREHPGAPSRGWSVRNRRSS